MTTNTQDRLVEDYLRRLERAAAGLTATARAELLGEIRAHIAEARAEHDDETGVREALDRLGAPEDIVAEAGGPVVPRSATEVPQRLRPDRELVAVLLLTVGSVILPLVGWLAGVVVMWSSNRWRTREKILGTLAIPGGLGTMVMGTLIWLTFASSSCVEGDFVQDGGNGVVRTDAGSCSAGNSLTVSVAVWVLLWLVALAVPLALLQIARRRPAS
jgi:uncharacterized membrane protein